MMLRSAALGCVAFLALAGPAAAGDGFYVGLGAGWDNQNNIKLDQYLFTPGLGGSPATGTLSTNDGAIIAGTLGYKLPMIPIRLEFESGYDWHSNNQFQSAGYAAAASGHANVASELVNALYDFPIGPGWNLYGGAGVGGGHVYLAPFLSDTGDQLAHVDHWGFMWQAIGGASFEIAPDADLFVDYRYRDAEAHATSYTPTFGPVGSHGITENVVMAGVRFYLSPIGPAMAEEAPPSAAPPPQYYNQPAPPPSPPPPSENNAPMNNGSTSGGASSGGPTNP
jgi:opacity protein-like surface antigen